MLESLEGLPFVNNPDWTPAQDVIFVTMLVTAAIVVAALAYLTTRLVSEARLHKRLIDGIERPPPRAHDWRIASPRPLEPPVTTPTTMRLDEASAFLDDLADYARSFQVDPEESGLTRHRVQAWLDALDRAQDCMIYALERGSDDNLEWSRTPHGIVMIEEPSIAVRQFRNDLNLTLGPDADAWIWDNCDEDWGLPVYATLGDEFVVLDLTAASYDDQLKYATEQLKED